MARLTAFKEIRRNSFWLLLARISAQLLGIVFVAVTARRFGAEVFGQLAVVTALVVIGNTFTTFGTDTFMIREISQTHNTELNFSAVLGLQLVLALVWWFASMLFIRNAPLLVYSLALFPLAFFSIFTTLLRGAERMDLFWLLSLANGFLQILAAIFATSLQTLCLFMLLGQILIAGIAYWVCVTPFPGLNLFPLRDFRPLVVLVWPFAALSFIAILSQRLGILSVSAWLDNQSTGLFSAAFRLVDGLKVFHFALLGALLPNLSRRAGFARRDLTRAFLVLLAISLTIVLVVSIFDSLIIKTIFGARFLIAAPILQILVWSLIPYSISSVLALKFVVTHAEQTLLKATIVSLASMMFFYSWLVPTYTLIGAAWAALMGECLQAALFIFFHRTRGARL